MRFSRTPALGASYLQRTLLQETEILRELAVGVGVGGGIHRIDEKQK